MDERIERAADDRLAPVGTLWVCYACGKTARDRYGDPGSRWDESCMLNSGLHEERMLVRNGSRVVQILRDAHLKGLETDAKVEG